MELFVRKKTTKIKLSASQRISNKNCMNYDHNKTFGLFKFQSGSVCELVYQPEARVE